MKKILIALTIFFVTLCLQKDVLAEDYSVEEPSIIVNLTDNNSTIFYSAKIVNNSEKELITNLDFNFPFVFENALVKLNGVAAPLLVDRTKLIVDLNNIKINVNTTAQLEMRLEVKNLKTQIDAYTRFYLPGFDLNNSNVPYSLKLRLPLDSEKVSYASESYQEETLDGIRQFSLQTINPVLFSFGESNSTLVNAEWSLIDQENDLNLKIPLPGSPISTFLFSDTINTNTASRDNYFNEYLVIDSKSGLLTKGAFTGTIINKDKEGYISSKNNEFYKGIDKVNFSDNFSINDSYLKVVEKFQPETSNSVIKRLNIDEIIGKEKQNSLDYSNTLVANLRKNNISAEIVYGIVNFPIINKYEWNFWVIYHEDSSNKWLQCDPYMEDLLGFDFFNSTNPERVAWGTVGDIQNIDDIGFQYFKNIDSIISFQNTSAEVEKNIEVVVDVTDKIFSGYNMPVQLIVHNNGNSSVYLNEIRFENVILKSGDIDQYLIIPKGVEIIPIKSAVIRNPLKSGTYNLSGKIILNVNGEEEEYKFDKDVQVEVDHERLIMNAVIVFTLVIVLYFSFRLYLAKLKQ